MTDILCKWLNSEVKLSVKVGATNFAHEFATGYLIGEVLEKYGLQADFSQFSQSKSAESKLNNFTRLEPVLHLLEVPFDTNVARDIMTEKHSVATRLMYQVFVAVGKKDRTGLTSVAMETMRPAAPVKLEAVESNMYKKRLKHLVPRQTDTDLDNLVGHFHQKQIEMEKTAFKERFEEEENHMNFLQEQRQNLIDKYHDNHAKKSEMLAKISDSSISQSPSISIKSSGSRQSNGSRRQGAATVHIPKPPPGKTIEGIKRRRELAREREAVDMRTDIDVFEERMKRTLPPSKPIGEEQTADIDNEYVAKIRKRLNEDVYARAEREKRRRKVLVDQMNAHESQEDARREEMLVKRLMRQSQQERRIAVQLLQTRHEKQIIRNNRLMREQQFSERRLKEFEEAMNREAEMAQLAKLEYMEQTKADQELHNQITQQLEQEQYQKHHDMCEEIIDQVVDYSCKVAEYRELTEKLVPVKLMRDWTSLFVSGKPLFEQSQLDEEGRPVTAEVVLEEERQALLDEGDFTEYRNMVGEWKPPTECTIKGPPRNNPIIGHVIKRLFDIVHPPTPPPPVPKFPEFPIKACVLGKTFSGKSTCLQRLADTHRLEVLSTSKLIQEALEAFNNQETMELVIEKEPPPPPSPIPSVSLSAEVTNVEGGSVLSGGGSVAVPPSNATDNKTIDNKTVESKAGDQSAENTSDVPKTGNTIEDTGEEKSDPEKPVVDEPPPSPEIQIVSSTRAVLGEKASEFLAKGEAIEDQLLVDVLVEAIRSIPEGTGWVLDNFPTTYQQAKLLEKALSGFDMNKKEKIAKSGGKGKKSLLAPDPRPPAPPVDPISGIDIVVLFEAADDVCLKRSAGRTQAVQSGTQYQQEFAPPPVGSATGVSQEEQVFPVVDPAHDQEQIQHRMTTFRDTWPKLEKWFTRFGTLKKVDSSQEEQELEHEVAHILETTLRKLKGLEPELPSLTEPESEEKTDAASQAAEQKPPEAEAVKPETASPAGSKKGSRPGSAKKSPSRPSSKEGKRDKSKSPARSRSGSKADTGKKSGKGSRASSGKSPKRGRSAGKRRTPEPEPEPEVEAPPSTPPPAPGSEQWQYVDQEIDFEICEVLSEYWTTLEKTYIMNGKDVFRNVRDERENIIQYFFATRKEFLAYLRRPDPKQEFVSQWHKEYNELAEDLRPDPESRGELHGRVDDMRDRLWEISDMRKAQAESERELIINDGWLDDRIGILCNHYITLMQAELDRYQDCVRIMRDYYKAPPPGLSTGEELTAQAAEYERLPLVELPALERPASAAGSISGDSQATGSQVAPSPRGSDRSEVKSNASHRSTTPTSRKKKSESASQQDLGDAASQAAEARIPLIPRRPASPDPNVAAKAKQDKAKKPTKPGDPSVDSPAPPQDADEKLIFDAHAMTVAAIEKILGTEEAIRDAEAEAELEKEREKEKEKEKANAAAKGKGGKGGKGDKKGKSRSPSPKKGGKGAKDSPAHGTPVPDEEESEEDKEKKLLKERAKMEYFTAIDEEATSAKARMDLVRAVGIAMMQFLRQKSEDLYTDMNDWLGARFLKEMESIDHLTIMIRQSIEDGEKIKDELVLEQDDFYLNEDVKTLKTPPPPPRPDPFEVPLSDAFTVEQIYKLYEQFMLSSPEGMISVKGFQDIFADLTVLTHGTGMVPDLWLNIPQDKLELMSMLCSQNGEYVDWRAFLLAASNPWPKPTQSQLLKTLAKFREMDQQNCGWVTREQYDKVVLWFGSEFNPATPEGVSDPYPFDRLAHLKQILFDIFSNQQEEPAKLNYIEMLMYLSSMMDPIEGFLRALSVATGTHMPRLPGKLGGPQAVSPRPNSQISLAESIHVDQTELEPILDPAVAAADDLQMPSGSREGSDRPVSNRTGSEHPGGSDVAPDGSPSESAPMVEEDIPASAMEALVSLDALMLVLEHGQSMRGDTHRFSVTADPEDAYSRERLAGVYHDLGSESEEPVLFSHLIEHPVIQDILAVFNTFRTMDLRNMLSTPPPADGIVEVNSVRTEQ